MWIRVIVLCLFVLAPSAARAVPIQMATQTGLASAEVSITFDEIILPSSTVLSDEYAGLGVTFSPGLLYNPGTANMSDSILGLDGRRLANFYPVTSIFSIYFVDPVEEAVVGILAPDITTFTAFHKGIEVETFQNSRLPQAQGFYGFTGITFDEIRVDAHSRVDEGRALLDNIQFTTARPIPEPSGVMLFALGFALLSVVRGWRLRNRSGRAGFAFFCVL